MIEAHFFGHGEPLLHHNQPRVGLCPDRSSYLELVSVVQHHESRIVL
jgi:hypothetical protein